MKLAEAEQHVRANHYFWYHKDLQKFASKASPGMG